MRQTQTLLRAKQLLATLLIVLSSQFATFAQETESEEAESPVTIKADFVSRYIWRGVYSGGMAVQPTLDYATGGFFVGSCGSYSFSGLQRIQETDLYIGYSFNDLLTLTVNDYYFFDQSAADFDYLNYSDTANHSIETVLKFEGLESFPLSLSAAVLVAGNDFKNTDGSRVYSSYVEAGYAFGKGRTAYNLFAGMALNSPDDNSAGFYGNKGAQLVNVGISASRSIQITDKFEIPLKADFIYNPAQNHAWLVFGLNLSAN